MARPKLKGLPTKEWLIRFRNVDENGCWLWTRGRGGFNCAYGHMNREYVHRIAWRLWRGTIPEGIQVLHKCDVPLCFNPDHLFLGTQLDNMRDQISKGRKLIGLKAPVAKLNEREVKIIRSSSKSCKSLGIMFGVCAQTICNVKNKACYKEV